MTKMEKLIVSADPETKQLIEEIQDSIADTVETKLKELLSNKISDIKIDSSKINLDLSPIMDRLGQIEQMVKEISGHRLEKTKLPDYLTLYRPNYSGAICKLTNNGKGEYSGTINQIDFSEFYIVDSNNVCYGLVDETHIGRDLQNPFCLNEKCGSSLYIYINLDISIYSITYRK